MAHICVIEDATLIRETLQRILHKLGHTVTSAVNGRDGLDLCDKTVFDIVITDIIMPEIEGIEVLRTIKEKSPQTRVIAMSGGGRAANTDFLKIAESLGADAILYKPVTQDGFMKALNICLPNNEKAS